MEFCTHANTDGVRKDIIPIVNVLLDLKTNFIFQKMSLKEVKQTI